jgi:signal transduction histidine kinase
MDRRVPEPGTGDEVQRLAHTMNSMLGRLERAALRQRTFVSDAAHELRGPVASIRTDVEATAAHLPTADVPAVLGRIGATTRQLEHLVEDLLVLASADEQSRPPTGEVDLDELVLRELERARSTSRVPIDAPVIDAARLVAHRDQLQRVVANVLDNAQRHADSAIIVELRTSDGLVELTVSDDGPGVPHELRERVFDRFARVDQARDRAHGGAGLGLAIARRIVEKHGGSIAFGDTAAGARVIVRLPLPPGADERTGMTGP